MTLTGNEDVQTEFAAMSHGALNLQELKNRKPEELLAYGEELGIEGASVLRKQDLMFAILKEMAEQDVPISGQGVLEVLSDGFGFLRSPEANYLPGPDDIYVSPDRSDGFHSRPATRWKERSGAPGRTNATSHSSSSATSTSRNPRQHATGCLSTISHRSIPRKN